MYLTIQLVRQKSELLACFPDIAKNLQIKLSIL